ncbi:MAG: hypothetical protein Q9178_007880 [Gyalolechia marmorata]
MSFGVSVSDFLLLGQLCWNVYKKCKDSTGIYAELTGEVSNFRSTVQETEELLSEQALTEPQEAKLLSCQQGCKAVLNDLDALLVKYESLGTRSQRTFDRMRMGHKDMNGIRQRLILNGNLLDSVVATYSRARLEKKLELLIIEVRSGKREGSVISVKGFEKTADDDQGTWDALRRDLEDIGISPEIIKEQRTFILDWFRDAVAAGGFEEDTPSSENNSLPSATLSEEDIPSQAVVGTDFDSDASSGPAQTSGSSTTGVQTTDRITKAQPGIANERSFGNTTAQTQPKRQSDRSREKKPRISALMNIITGRNSQFFAAAYVGDDARIKRLLSKQVDINALDKRNVTALHIAAEMSRLSTVQLLLGDGADFNVKATNGNTALHAAVDSSLYSNHSVDCKVVQLLLDHGAHIEAKNDIGNTPLGLASMELFGGKEMVLVLLAKGANIEAKNDIGDTPLGLASLRGGKEVVPVLLAKGANIEAKNNNGDTPLLLACWHGSIATVSVLLERGANLEATNTSSETPLLLATELSVIALMEFLLDKGAKIEARNGTGDTPLLLACRQGSIATVSVLIERGADLEARTRSGKTPLLLATKLGHHELMLHLLDIGANIDAKDIDDNTPLLLASGQENVVLVTSLLDKGANIDAEGADIEARDVDGRTALLLAALWYRHENISLLLDMGADIKVKDFNGQTALMLVIASPYRAVDWQVKQATVKLLLENGAHYS